MPNQTHDADGDCYADDSKRARTDRRGFLRGTAGAIGLAGVSLQADPASASQKGPDRVEPTADTRVLDLPAEPTDDNFWGKDEGSYYSTTDPDGTKTKETGYGRTKTDVDTYSGAVANLESFSAVAGPMSAKATTAVWWEFKWVGDDRSTVDIEVDYDFAARARRLELWPSDESSPGRQDGGRPRHPTDPVDSQGGGGRTSTETDPSTDEATTNSAAVGYVLDAISGFDDGAGYGASVGVQRLTGKVETLGEPQELFPPWSSSGIGGGHTRRDSGTHIIQPTLDNDEIYRVVVATHTEMDGGLTTGQVDFRNVNNSRYRNGLEIDMGMDTTGL